MADNNPALAKAAHVEQLADSLSAAADTLHERVVELLRQAAPGPDAKPEQARALFDNEVALRQQANSLYLDASAYAIAGLATSQQSLLELSEAARKKIARMDKLQDLAAISADLLALAGAIAAARPQDIATALEDMRDHIKERRQEKAQRADPPA